MKIDKRAITKIQGIIVIAILAIAVVSGLAYYFTLAPRGPKAENVEIVYLTYTTGALAYYGEMVLRGLHMALDEINEGGGISSLGGAELVVHEYDAGATAAEATSALRRGLNEHPHTCGILGSLWSGTCLVLAEITEREKIPFLSGPWVDKITEQGYKYFFRISPKASEFSEWGTRAFWTLAEEQEVTLTKIAIVVDDNPSCVAERDAIVEFSEEKGIDVVVDEIWIAPLKDATPIVLKMQNSQPQFMISSARSVVDLSMLVAKMHELDVDIPILIHGAVGFSPDFRDTLGDLTEGVLIISEMAITEGYEHVEEKFLELYPEYTFMPKDSILAYGWTWAMKEVIELAANNNPEAFQEKDVMSMREAVRSALATIDLASGPAAINWGRVKFDANGDYWACHNFILQWQGIKPVVVYPEVEATAPAIWPWPKV